MKKMLMFVSASLCLAIAGGAQAGVKGSVNHPGKAPAGEAIDMASDPKCKAMNPKATTDDVKVNGGKLADVIVFVKNPPAGEHKAEGKPTLDQKGCMYTPKAVAVMVGQDLEIVNSDATLHNVHAFAKPGEFNQAMPKQGQKINKKFKKKQMVDVKCDVHKWMHATVGVFDHPFFAVSNDKGEFEIPGTLPDGEYDVEAFHSKLGTKSGKVKVAGGAGTVDFSY
jgi:plastocyanin